MEFFLVHIFPYLDLIRTRKDSVFGHFSCSVMVCNFYELGLILHFLKETIGVVVVLVIFIYQKESSENLHSVIPKTRKLINTK